MVLNSLPEAACFTVTVAPGTTAPVGSVTVPEIEEVTWPKAVALVTAAKRIIANALAILRIIDELPPWLRLKEMKTWRGESLNIASPRSFKIGARS
jgi:hypothetical protein